MEMIDNASRLYRELLHYTKETLEQPSTFLKKTALVISKANAAIKEINDQLRVHVFADQETEVNFFKTVLPPIYAHHHIYMDLHRLEVDKPILEKKAEEYYLKQVDKMDEFLEHHAAFYKYYREEATHHDYQYFTRKGSEAEESFEWYIALIDRCCMTPYSLQISMLLAYQYIKNYINGILLKLKDNEGLQEMPLIEQNNIAARRLHWTGTKVAAVELCYALFANKCLDNGKAPIYQIVNHFEQSFGIELPFPHRTMQDVATRKAGPTVQLDDMKRDLTHFVDRVFLKPYAK